jgi:hypothetical protein
MPKAAQRGLIGVRIGGQTADCNYARPMIRCEKQFAGPVETCLAFLPLARQALDEAEAFGAARRQERNECVSR